MSLSVSSDSVCQKRTLSSLLAGHVLKKPRLEDAERLQREVIQLLEQHVDICSLLREAGNPNPPNVFIKNDVARKEAASGGIPSAIAGSFLVSELRRQAGQLGVPVSSLSVKMALDRLTEIMGSAEEEEEEGERRELLTCAQRVQLSVLLESCSELLSLGAFCPQLLWQQHRREQRSPRLEVLYHLHLHNILHLKDILESDEGVKSWLVSQLRALCGWTPPQDEDETKKVQNKVLSMVVEVLVGSGFEVKQEAAGPDRRISQLCCSVLDDCLYWILDSVDQNLSQHSSSSGAQQWIQLLGVLRHSAAVSAEALQRFFTHALTQTLTYKPGLTVSDAVSMQSEWTFAKTSSLLTSLFCKLAVIFSMEQLLTHLQQVLETHEVNWKHVLCFLSTLLVYNPCAQPSIRELLSRLLSSAFESYDLENLITAFLLARQGALEGTGVFPSYHHWFKSTFGCSSGCHATNKKSLVFLLKFLSDLVPFEPPQYLKIHLLHPPFVPVKYRTLLMEYVSLAKTRLADLKESVEDMGLYEDVSGAAAASAQPQCQAVQDVEKAASLFESTGRISATVMEASIFRRQYFLTRFLPALLTPRVLPVKPDSRMKFIEALRKAEKIPAALHSSYVESCQKQRQQDGNEVCVDHHEDPLEVLKVQLQEFGQLVGNGSDGEVSAQLSRISHTLSVIFPGHPDELIGQPVIKLHIDAPPSPELNVQAVNMILRNFCQCLFDASRAKPPNKQTQWSSMLVDALLGNTQLSSCIAHRLWDLLHNQGSSLASAHLLGLAAFMVHLHVSSAQSRPVEFVPAALSDPLPLTEALSAALPCRTRVDMLFTIRFCVAVVSYGFCRSSLLPQHQQQAYIPPCLYKKLLYLIPRLLPEVRRPPLPADSAEGEHCEQEHRGLWSSVTDDSTTWRKTSRQMWRHAAFHQLQETPQYGLSFSEWLNSELRVQRSEDALSDPERQEYQQWACQELYLSRPVEQGGCGGQTRILCSHILNAVMDQETGDQKLDKLGRVSETGTCLPDILSRLQEVVYNMDAGRSRAGRPDVCDVLFDLFSLRCSSTSHSIGTQLDLQHTLQSWNRVLVTLPAAVLVKVKNEGGRKTLDCHRLIEHINQHQRKACPPAGFLSCLLTSHFLRGLLCASVSCGRPSEEVNKAWAQMSLSCPLLLVSTVHWWERVCPVLSSLWYDLSDEESLPEQLQPLSDCLLWACRLQEGLRAPQPAAAPLLLAASLHCVWTRRCGEQQDFSATMEALRPESEKQNTQVLVFLLYLCVNDHLSALLYPLERLHDGGSRLCSELLAVLLDSADWLLIFTSSEQRIYQAVTMVTSDENTRLMPLAFYSLLLQLHADLLHRALCCPGFVHTAVLCYINLFNLFLDGQTPPPANEPHSSQMETSQILSRAKQFLLRAVSQMSMTAVSSGQLRQLEARCAETDPEVAAALRVHLDSERLSPEMDFL
ncbi:Fanconi anemia group A protein [Genypterus blacodes]|uniref:Fanconi anemia group A protein n=1 Tax=Genypterus blacodes TaxID=154954 RepID=UPI003F768D89